MKLPECLPIININIEGKQYSALIDTGATLSLVNEQLNTFNKIKLDKPIPYSTINSKSTIEYEILTSAPNECSLPKKAMI